VVTQSQTVVSVDAWSHDAVQPQLSNTLMETGFQGCVCRAATDLHLLLKKIII